MLKNFAVSKLIRTFDLLLRCQALYIKIVSNGAAIKTSY
jgi:hypothetical protein